MRKGFMRSAVQRSAELDEASLEEISRKALAGNEAISEVTTRSGQGDFSFDRTGPGCS